MEKTTVIRHYHVIVQLNVIIQLAKVEDNELSWCVIVVLVKVLLVKDDKFEKT